MQLSKDINPTGVLQLPSKLEARYMEPKEQKRLQEGISLGSHLQNRLQLERKVRPVTAEQIEIELRKSFLRPEHAPCTSIPRAAQIVLGLDDHVLFDFCSSRFSESLTTRDGRPL